LLLRPCDENLRRDDVPLFFLKFKDGPYTYECIHTARSYVPSFGMPRVHTHASRQRRNLAGPQLRSIQDRTSCRHFVSREHNKASQAERYLPPERYLRAPGHLHQETFDFSPTATRSPNLSFTLAARLSYLVLMNRRPLDIGFPLGETPLREPQTSRSWTLLYMVVEYLCKFYGKGEARRAARVAADWRKIRDTFNI